MNQRHISLSSDVLAVIDPSNPKFVRVFDIQSGKDTNTPIEHSTEIIEMDLNQVEMSSERKMCFIDSNRDMFLSMVHKPGGQGGAWGKKITITFQWPTLSKNGWHPLEPA